MTQPQCHECASLGQLVGGNVIYPYRPDLEHMRFYKCPFCPDTYVGCHPGTTNALGRMADKRLRLAKSHAHAVFDPLWERKMERDGIKKGEARGKAYAWLAGQLGIDPKDCHIGMMDIETCGRVVLVCRPYARAR